MKPQGLPSRARSGAGAQDWGARVRMTTSATTLDSELVT